MLIRAVKSSEVISETTGRNKKEAPYWVCLLFKSPGHRRQKEIFCSSLRFFASLKITTSFVRPCESNGPFFIVRIRNPISRFHTITPDILCRNHAKLLKILTIPAYFFHSVLHWFNSYKAQQSRRSPSARSTTPPSMSFTI